MEIDDHHNEGPLIRIFKEIQHKKSLLEQAKRLELEKKRELQRLELEKKEQQKRNEAAQLQQLDLNQVQKLEYTTENNNHLQTATMDSKNSSSNTPKQILGYLMVIVALFSITTICYVIYLFISSLHLDLHYKSNQKSSG